MTPSAKQLIETYGLRPHLEGGFYREVYRSSLAVISPAASTPRSAGTHIYFLLLAGQVSRFHKVAHDEIWNFYQGAPLRLVTLDERGGGTGCAIKEELIGPDHAGYVSIVPGGVYQAAEPTGELSLMGCTVAPGFDFADFSFLSDNAAHAASLISARPDLQRLL